MKKLSELMREKHLTPAELDETRAPVAPTLDRKYIKGTPENKAYKASKKPRTGHPTNKVAEDKDPCWDSHEMVGMKTKNGKKVPNCVPKEGVEEDKDFSKYIMKPTKTEPKIVRKTNPSGRTTDHTEYEVHGTLSSHKRTFKSKKEAEEYFNTVKEETIQEGTFKVDLEGLPPVFLDGESISDVRARLRTLVKRPADQIQDITRVQPVQMKRYFKDMMLGKDESTEVDEETIMEEEQEFSSMNVTPLRECLADVFAMYFMAHQFHWNVKGLDFIQYHNFLGELYEQLHEEVDTIAEQIRINGEGAPTSILELAELTNVDEATSVITNPHEMMIRLSDANDDVIISFYSALDVAEQAGNEGLINFLADRIDAHGKIGWMLTSSKE